MGIYDYLYVYGLSYDNFIKRLYQLSNFLPIDYAKLQKQCDELYDETEYDLFVMQSQPVRFENICDELWRKTLKEPRDQDYTDAYDDYCNRLDERFSKIHEKYGHNLYIKVLWAQDGMDRQEITDELLDLGKRFRIVQYCSFVDDSDNVILVALHEQFDLNNLHLVAEPKEPEPKAKDDEK